MFATISLSLHIAAGLTTLLAGPLAIFYNFKNIRYHRLAGKAFFYAMLVVCVTSVAGFIKYPDNIFYQFLLGIACFVFAGVTRGVREIFLMKGAPVTNFDWFNLGFQAVTGLSMLTMAAMLAFKSVSPAFPILFGVFGTGAMVDLPDLYRKFRNPQAVHRMDWQKLHTQTMIGAFIASTTAFTVNAAHFLPWWAQWFGPTLALVPLQVYFGRKIKKMKQQMQAREAAL